MGLKSGVIELRANSNVIPCDRDRNVSIGTYGSGEICLAAQMLGLDTGYHLIWNMGHGSNEGESTGTFIG